jgi:hypothetical protein
LAEAVQAPTRRPRQGGIKSVAGDFIAVDRLAVANGSGGLVWEDSGCSFPSETRAGCYDSVTPQEDKVPVSPERFTTITPPFARYAGVECFLGGDAVGPTYTDQAKANLEQGEDRSIEAVLWTWANDADVTGAATGIAAGIGAAEEYADATYVGAPVILMSRAAAVLADEAGVVHRDGDRLVTTNGNWVLATNAADDATIIALGAVAVYTSDTTAVMAIEHKENLAMAIAERVYAIGVDCDFRYAVTVTPAP